MPTSTSSESKSSQSAEVKGDQLDHGVSIMGAHQPGALSQSATSKQEVVHKQSPAGCTVQSFDNRVSFYSAEYASKKNESQEKKSQEFLKSLFSSNLF